MPSNFPSSYKWHSLYFKTCDRMINICVNVNVSIYHKSPLHTKGFPSIMLCRSIFIFHTYKKKLLDFVIICTLVKKANVFFLFTAIFSLSFPSFHFDETIWTLLYLLSTKYLLYYDNNCFNKIDMIIYSIIVRSIYCLNVKKT